MKHQPDVSRETAERLRAYIALLQTWNRRINLVGPGDASAIWQRHVADSLQLLALMPPLARDAIDVGSGAGLPGLVLAITSGVTFTLIEADLRKAAFLREAIRVTGAPATIMAARAESVTAAAPLVTARALAPLPRLLALCVPLLEPGGCLLLPKGAKAEAEIEQARATWTMRVERHISVTGGGGVILRLSEVQRA